MIPGVIAINSAYLSQPAQSMWSPLNMATIPPIYIDAINSSITHSGGAVSEISNLGSLGSNGNFSQSDNAKRPSYFASGFNGLPCLQFDGVDDVLISDTAAAKNIFRNVGYPWFFVVYQKLAADASPTSRILAAALSGTTGIRASICIGMSTTGNANKIGALHKRTDGGSVSSPVLTNTAVLTSALCSVEIRFGAGAIRTYVDGSSVLSSATTAGLTSDTPSVSAITIGAGTQTSTFADAKIAAIVIGNTDLPVSEREKLEGWAAHKWGLTANLPAGHPYKTAAPTI